MSSVTISYKSLSNASSEAKSVAKKLNSYADSIQKTVYNKLNRYSGDWTNSICSAYSHADAKMTSLRAQADSYNTYASNLIDLRDECIRVDEAVRSKVSSLTASFKEAHGIRNSAIENAISYFFTSIGNSSFVGRWLGDGIDLLRAGRSYLKDSIKEWYNYKGGKELLKGIAVGLLEVAIAVASVVAAIATFVAGVITFGAVLVLVAGVVAGIIAFSNGIENIVNEKRAYDARQNDDPATGRRLSDQNTIQDRLREGDIGGNDSTLLWIDLNNVSESRKWATGIDIVNLCCTIVTVVNSCGKLLKNGYKWATGNSMKHYTDVFSKDFFKGIGGNIKSSFSDIGKAFKFRDWSIVKDFGTRLLSDFKHNLNKQFLSFDSVKDFAKTSKNYLSITKDIVEDGFNFNTIFSTGIENIVIPCVTVFTVTKDSPGIDASGKGQISFDFFDHVTIDDFYGIGDKINSKIIQSSVFNTDNVIDTSVLSKLSTSCNINISIPEIYVPDVSVLNVA